MQYLVLYLPVTYAQNIPSRYTTLVLLIFITYVLHYYDDACMVTACLVSSIVCSYIAFWCVQVCVHVCMYVHCVPSFLNVRLNYIQRLETFCSGRKKKTLSTKPQATFELDSPLKLGKSWQEQYNSVSTQAKNPYVANLVELADQQISNLKREINVLKEGKIQQSNVVATLQNKVFVIYFFFCMCLIIMSLYSYSRYYVTGKSFCFPPKFCL